MEEVSIVYITDEAFVLPTVISIVSLRENLIWDGIVRVFVLSDSISENSKKLLIDAGGQKIHVIPIDIDTEKYEDIANELKNRTGNIVSRCAICKFEIAYILKNIDIVLYLDGDTIINKDIAALLRTQMNGVYISAVNDMGDFKQAREGTSDNSVRIGVQGEYFNSGVMLMNLELMRKDRFPEKCLDYRLNGLNDYMDQDALNYAVDLKRNKISFRYNFLTELCFKMSFDEMNDLFFDSKYISREECINDQCILHMAGYYKAWKYDIKYITNIFRFYYNKSPYTDKELVIESVAEKMYSLMSKKIEELLVCISKEKEQEANLYARYQMMEWRFPYEKIKRNSRIVLYGAGEVGRSFYDQIQKNKYCKIVKWVDRNYREMGSEVEAVETIFDCDYDSVIIALSRRNIFEEVKMYLFDLGISLDRITGLF